MKWWITFRQAFETRFSPRQQSYAQRGARQFFLLLSALTLAFACTPLSVASAEEAGEAELKAAFVYRFIFFTSWPSESNTGTRTLCVLADEETRKAFRSVHGMNVNGQKLVVLHPGPTTKEVAGCDVLFLGSNIDSATTGTLLAGLKNRPVLTIGETPAFWGYGGIVRLTKQQRKVAFDVNVGSADKARIKLRAKLLRLAANIVKGKEQ